MKRFIEHTFKIYPGEFRLFMWVAGLIFTFTASTMLLDNYAETVFLKRYGVRQLPNIYMANAIITFFLMNYVIVVLRRLSTVRLLRYLFLICPALVVALRFFLHFPDIVYPLFYVFKTQFETLLLLLIWNMSNELFNTRQAKRIFPVIMAADVLGRIGGSGCTSTAAALVGIDNVVFIYAVMQIVAFSMTVYLERGFTIFGAQKLVKQKKGKSAFFEELGSLFSLSKSSTLFRILVIITLASNLMIPLFNYQFNFILDHHFGSEGGLLSFFGWFRSVFNGISFLLLLVTGRFFAFFGLTLAVLLHPFNYIIVFLAMLVHFKLGSAIYGRISTNMIRSTLNAPSLAAIIGLFPRDVGNRVRPLLRGTVVRIGIFGGSLILLGAKDFLHPKMLSILGMLFGLFWLAASYYLRRHYVSLVVGLLLQGRVDFEQLEKTDLKVLFKSPHAVENLVKRFKEERGEPCVLYAELLKIAEIPGIAFMILATLPEKEPAVQKRLIRLIRKNLAAKHFPIMAAAMENIHPTARLAYLEAMAETPHEGKGDFFNTIVRETTSEATRIVALLGLLKSFEAENREKAEHELSKLASTIQGENVPILMRAIGISKNPVFKKGLLHRLEVEHDDLVKAYILDALRKINGTEINKLVYPIIHSPTPVKPLLRKAAIEAYTVHDDRSLNEAMKFLASPHRKIRRNILRKIENSGNVSASHLLSCLLIAKPDVRRTVLDIIRTRGVTQLELQNFINQRLAETYRNIFTIVRFNRFKPDPVKDIVIRKLNEDILEAIYSILYTLELEYMSDDMRVIRRAIMSEEGRARYNAVEALENLIGSNLAQRLIPLVDDIPADEKGRKGKKFFPIEPQPADDIASMVNYVLSWGDDVLREGAVTYAFRAYPEVDWIHEMSNFVQSSETGREDYQNELLRKIGGDASGKASSHKESSGLSVMERVLHLQNIQIFSDIKVNELAAIAIILEEIKRPENDVLIREGEVNNAVYLVTSGNVEVVRNYGKTGEERVAVLGIDGHFGEMALLHPGPRTATVRTLEPSTFLTLEKDEFENLVLEYPKIILNVARVLSNRLRELHEELQVRSMGSE